MFQPNFLLCACLTTLLFVANPLTAQEVPTQGVDGVESIQVEGLLKEKKKYSFTVAGADKDYEFRLDSTTVVAARIFRPVFDWTKLTVTGAIPASAKDGRFRNNLKVAYRLASPIYFRHRFDSFQRFEELVAKTPVPLDRPELSKVPLLPRSPDNDKPVWSGELKSTSNEGVFEVQLGQSDKLIQPNWSTLVLEGFSLLDIKPYASDLFVDAKQVDGKWIAKRIEFSPRQNLQEIFAAPEPKCLVIGDIISFNYMPALIKELSGKVQVVHANANCQGSDNCKQVHRWVGDPRDTKLRWDVIVFNFGQADSTLDQATYQDNLKKCLAVLKQTGSKLVWVESTPVPYGFNDENLKAGDMIPEARRFDLEFENANPKSFKPGRMKTQNRWAAEVFAAHPEIAICPVWDVVKDDSNGRYKEWWYGKEAKFKYPQSIPLAKTIAQKVLDALR